MRRSLVSTCVDRRLRGWLVVALILHALTWALPMRTPHTLEGRLAHSGTGVLPWPPIAWRPRLNLLEGDMFRLKTQPLVGRVHEHWSLAGLALIVLVLLRAPFFVWTLRLLLWTWPIGAALGRASMPDWQIGPTLGLVGSPLWLLEPLSVLPVRPPIGTTELALAAAVEIVIIFLLIYVAAYGRLGRRYPSVPAVRESRFYCGTLLLAVAAFVALLTRRRATNESLSEATQTLIANLHMMSWSAPVVGCIVVALAAVIAHRLGSRGPALVTRLLKIGLVGVVAIGACRGIALEWRFGPEDTLALRARNMLYAVVPQLALAGSMIASAVAMTVLKERIHRALEEGVDRVFE